MQRFISGLKYLMVAVMVITPGVSSADETRYSLGLGLEFISGTYGTGTRTNAVYIPFTAAVYPNERLDLSVEIPFVYQSNNNVVFSQGGGMHGSQSAGNGSTSTTSGTGMMGDSSGMGGGMGQGGIGDITVKTGYVLVTETESVPQVRPNVFLKIPTADKNKALGTGEFDGGAAIEVLKWLDNWFAYAEAGYAIQGKTSIISLNDYLYYTVGTGYQVTDALRPMFILKGSTATVAGGEPLLEARLKLKYQASKHTGLEGYVAKGITRSSPDYGTGLYVYYDF